MDNIKIAQEKFAELILSEYARIQRMREDTEVKDFSKLEKIIIGILPGDGIGPIIMEQALRVLNYLLKEEIASGKIEIRHIEGMTIENRDALGESLPEPIFEQMKKCDVLLKGPMVTPRASEIAAGEYKHNLVSPNSLMRRGLELFAAVRPIRIPEKGIDWAFFRENIEGEYIWGNKGIQVNEELADTGLLQEGTEQNEQEDVSGANAQRITNNAIGGNEQVSNNTLQRETTMGQEAGQICTNQTIDEENGSDDDNGGADYTPAGGQYQNDTQACHDNVQSGIGTGAELQGLVVDDKVGNHAEEQPRQHDIIPRELPAVCVLGGGVHQESQADGKAQMGIAQDLQGHLVGDGSVQLEQSKDSQHHSQELFALF